MRPITHTSDADRLLEQASHRFRAGEIGRDGLERVAGQLDAMAWRAGDGADRIEIEAAASAVRDLPRQVDDEALLGSLPASELIRHVERIVAWAWEELPTTRARMERVRAALKRIDLLPEASPQERYALETQRADLAWLLASLEAQP